MENKEIVSYGKYFSEEKFLKKILRIMGDTGKKMVYHSMTLFYCYKDKETPTWAKNIVLGALGYLILPTDLIADFLPVIGFTDDIAIIFAALSAVAGSIKDAHRDKAQAKVREWFSTTE